MTIKYLGNPVVSKVSKKLLKLTNLSS